MSDEESLQFTIFENSTQGQEHKRVKKELESLRKSYNHIYDKINELHKENNKLHGTVKRLKEKNSSLQIYYENLIKEIMITKNEEERNYDKENKNTMNLKNKSSQPQEKKSLERQNEEFREIIQKFMVVLEKESGQESQYVVKLRKRVEQLLKRQRKGESRLSMLEQADKRVKREKERLGERQRIRQLRQKMDELREIELMTETDMDRDMKRYNQAISSIEMNIFQMRR